MTQINQENQETDQSQSQSMQSPDKTMYTVDVYMVGSIVSSVDVLAASEEQAKGIANDLMSFEVKKYTKKQNGIRENTDAVPEGQ